MIFANQSNLMFCLLWVPECVRTVFEFPKGRRYIDSENMKGQWNHPRRILRERHCRLDSFRSHNEVRSTVINRFRNRGRARTRLYICTLAMF
jgi:hypothetical protein